jgi:hypothetical protein
MSNAIGALEDEVREYKLQASPLTPLLENYITNQAAPTA